MDNQQLSTRTGRITLIARNGKVGDGTLWKHPQCKNAKYIVTSTDPSSLHLKQLIAPFIFKSSYSLIDTTNHKGRYPNAKPIYRLASLADPIFTMYKEMDKGDVFELMTLLDFALWFQDDGCVYTRKDRNSTRYILSIGDCVNTPDRRAKFEEAVSKLFGSNWGHIGKNTSNASINNYAWNPTVEIGRLLQETYRELIQFLG